jgi:hypothetical protein
MIAKLPTVETTLVEREISARAKAAKLRLRHDKVVRGLDGDLKAALTGVLPKGRSVLITVTAPIKLPSKTAAMLVSLVREGLPRGEVRKTVHGNRVRVRAISRPAANLPQVLTLVHNPESDAGLILDIAEERFRQRN